MAGASAERQETGFVKAVNDAVRKNKKNPITIIAGKTKITGIVGAQKYGGRQESGSEPYTDVILFLKKGQINLSLKGEEAPSLAGGGLRGLETVVPGIAGKFMKAAHKKLIKDGYNPGDKVPDVYGKISEQDKLKIVIGNKAMGGPIDYMYLGKMEVSAKYEEKTNILTFKNGALTDSKTFAKTHDLYFRLRARREDQRFDPDAEQGGIPKIYGKSPSRGDSAGRIVVTDKVPNNAMIVKL